MNSRIAHLAEGPAVASTGPVCVTLAIEAPMGRGPTLSRHNRLSSLMTNGRLERRVRRAGDVNLRPSLAVTVETLLGRPYFQPRRGPAGSGGPRCGIPRKPRGPGDDRLYFASLLKGVLGIACNCGPNIGAGDLETPAPNICRG